MKIESNISAGTEMNTRQSAQWLRKEKRNQERATGTGAALIKRKLYNLGYNEDSDEDTDVAEPVNTPFSFYFLLLLSLSLFSEAEKEKATSFT